MNDTESECAKDAEAFEKMSVFGKIIEKKEEGRNESWKELSCASVAT